MHLRLLQLVVGMGQLRQQPLSGGTVFSAFPCGSIERRPASPAQQWRR